MTKRFEITARVLLTIVVLVVFATPAPAADIIEGTVSSVTTTATVSGSSSTSSSTSYGAHLRLDAPVTRWGLDVTFATTSQGGGTDNDYVAFLTYRWQLPLTTLRFGVGLEGENASNFGNGFSLSVSQVSPVVGVMGDFSAGRAWPGFSIEAGAWYAPAITGTITVSVPGSSASGPITGSEWFEYAGFRYTVPGTLGLTIAGGYNFSQANVSVSGTPESTTSSGPYLNVGIAF